MLNVDWVVKISAMLMNTFNLIINEAMRVEAMLHSRYHWTIYEALTLLPTSVLITVELN